MSREISLFSDYHQKENSVTNYCGLVMKLIYENSPQKFEELLATLTPNNCDIQVGPIFSQQTKAVKSIPDLAITQRSFSIFFENKLTDWFHTSQIKKHIEGFNESVETKILFLLSNFENNIELDPKFASDIKAVKKDGIIVQPISYEDFIGALEHVTDTEYLNNILEEFKTYLDLNNLLPKWKYLLDVVNCKRTMDEIENGAYMCPDQGGAYSHRRAKYFGPYADKTVSKIYEIDAVMSVARNMEYVEVKWKNKEIKDEELKAKAKSIVNNNEFRTKENKEIPIQVFLLSNGEETNFYKDSSGGMMQSKLYFWDIAKSNNIDCSKELAKELKDKKWSSYK